MVRLVHALPVKSPSVRAVLRRRGRAALILALASAAFGAPIQAPGATPRILVGPNVLVSKAWPKLFHAELWAAADPKHNGRLILASMASDPDTVDERSIVYVSSDHGRSWSARLVTGDHSEDPATAFGPDGSAYFLHLNGVAGGVELYRSADGGDHWSAPTPAPFMDRPYLAVSPSGTLFVDGHVRPPQDSRSFVFSLMTAPAGKGFSPILTLPQSIAGGITPGEGAFLSDGTYVAVVESLTNLAALNSTAVQKQLGWVGVVTSTDGGQSLQPPLRAADWWNATGVDYLSNLPHIAIDASAGKYRDRIYLTWSDTRSGRSEIWLTWSGDRGQTWSPANRVNDDVSPPGPGPDHLQPAIAVNNRGVVGVSWYDRRDAKDDRGWRTRFSASLDGGVTFMPSVAASQSAYTPSLSRPATMNEPLERVMKNTGEVTHHPRWSFAYIGGDTGTIAASADGAFHLFWPDNRTGVMQVWTAEARVGVQ